MRQTIGIDTYDVPTVRSFTQATLAAPGAVMLYLSGFTARNEQGIVSHHGDVAAQTHLLLQQMQRVVEKAGGAMEDAVKITTFVIDPEDIPTVATIRLEYFGDPGPASSTVAVSRLFDPEQLVEIEAMVPIALERLTVPMTSSPD
ncbi:MAG: RidA family protein [Acidimicrobiia bacterium]|nr:RidA family protein [Acidimicrobiia bacterium]